DARTVARALEAEQHPIADRGPTGPVDGGGNAVAPAELLEGQGDRVVVAVHDLQHLDPDVAPLQPAGADLTGGAAGCDGDGPPDEHQVRQLDQLGEAGDPVDLAGKGRVLGPGGQPVDVTARDLDHGGRWPGRGRTGRGRGTATQGQQQPQRGDLAN